MCLFKSKGLRESGEDDEAIDYFANILPRMKQKVLHDDSLKGIKFYEAFQKPGDVIYVPGTWWHGVVNMSDAVAVTQNF